MLVTRDKRTPYEVAEAFQKGMQETEPGPMLEEYITNNIRWEKTESTDTELLKHYEESFYLGAYYVYDLPIMHKNKFRLTKTALHWLCFASKENVEMFNCLMGMVATLFYKDHSSQETITFKWLADQGLVRLVDPLYFYKFYQTAKIRGDHRATVFDKMTPEQYFQFDAQLK